MFYETALFKAVECDNVEMVKLLISNDKIDVNIPYIPKYFYFYEIDKLNILHYSKLNTLMEFKNMHINRIFID